MFKNVQEWWNALVGWLTGSQQSASKEAVEGLLDEPQVRAFYNIAEAHMRSGGRGRFPQVLRGGAKPSDRGDQKDFIPGLPAGLDYKIDEWEGPNGKGWALTAYCMDGGEEWQLRISSDKGVEGWSKVGIEQ